MIYISIAAIAIVIIAIGHIALNMHPQDMRIERKQDVISNYPRKVLTPK